MLLASVPQRRTSISEHSRLSEVLFSEVSKSGVDRFRRNLKLRAVSYLGGACIDCGYDRCVAALCFHHVEPNLKHFSISKDGNTAPWSEVQKELDKCVLLCLNCHAEAHAREDSAARLAVRH